MTVALAGRAPATFEIKSANLPLVALLLKSADIAALAADLAARFGDVPDFFDNDPLVIDLSPLQPQADAMVEFGTLLELLRSYRVHPVAVRGGNASLMAAALRAGLVAAPEVVLSGLRQAQPERGEAQPERGSAQPERGGAQPERGGNRPAEGGAQPERGRKPQSVRPEPVEGTDRREPVEGPGRVEGSHALIIDKPLRSGQQVYARGRDLVVLSMVNAGAEVIADGHIHVYAPLRGKAIAGARGNTEARILALCLEPELISIAGVYRTSEVPLPANVLSKPTQVRLVGGVEGKLVMDPLK
jgi:septum site-determining protein MinC